MKKILFVDYGGLGDHLQFSTLPESFHNNGYETYISSKSVFRSIETFDLIWGKNPYIKGFSDESPNCGHIGLSFNGNDYSMNRNWEILFNVDSGSKYPMVYNDPIIDRSFENSVVIDLNGYSQPNIYNFEIIKNKINEIIHSNKFSNIYYILPNDINYSKNKNQHIEIENSLKLNIKSIFEYYNIICSCNRFISIWSGGSHLASAIKNKYNNNLQIDCFSDNTNKSFYWYDNVNYIKGAMIGSLYH